MDLEIQRVRSSRITSTDLENLGFGEIFSDHMFVMDYQAGTWRTPRIVPFGPMDVLPSMCCLHYGQMVFEGLKAFRTEKGIVQLFRPEKYHERFNRSCRRLCIPETEYDAFITPLKTLLTIDKAWIPKKRGYSLYIRPFIIASDSYLGVKVSKSYRYMIITSPVGLYYKEGVNPVSLITSTEYIRAAKGGLGMAKTPANYAATLLAAQEAIQKGFSQILWLDANERRYVEEVGTMNMFFCLDGRLVTPALEGTILQGVTRTSVIEIARDWGIPVEERRISIEEILDAARDGRLQEAFGTGTAAVISPVGLIQHKDRTITVHGGKTGPIAHKLYEEITGIQYGERPDRYGWCVRLE
ncbi:MAG: branched-chain amino acid aminotransferase [bacterium]